jgi:succinate dehydrogenase/fumarate reductase cytochrome b subunit
LRSAKRLLKKLYFKLRILTRILGWVPLAGFIYGHLTLRWN